ncbi:AAA family ATPase [Gorillibacterium sp. CAU 1737]|uniref:AAA family ATPase n=1 Tax=Gorillibacterium sp. CAU 1737 TaxID=3140362 RepID=UPI003261CE39
MEERLHLDWIAFYSEMADKLLPYKNNRQLLLHHLQEIYETANMKYPFMEEGQPMDDICPFTVFGSINKGISNENRVALLSAFADKLKVQSPVPSGFDGVPVLNNLRAWFFAYRNDRGADDISSLWSLFESAIAFADQPAAETQQAFTTLYDKVSKQSGIKWSMTIGLFWIRPYSFLNLDERNRSYLTNGHHSLALEIPSQTKLKQFPNSSTYLRLIAICQGDFKRDGSPYQNFPELSYAAWQSSTADEDFRGSSASLLKWFSPLILALRKLGGSATPEQARNQIARDLNLPESTITETRGKTGSKKFDNEVAWARNYLAYEGFIDKADRGVWTLTNKGLTESMDEELASAIFLKWVEILRERRKNRQNNAADDQTREIRYWLYAPGSDSFMWSEFYKDRIMAIEWDEMGDLRQYPSKNAVKAKMKEVYGDKYSYTNSVLATWQFANELKPGDIVYVKRGRQKIVGRGIIESDYRYDSLRKSFKHIRSVNWTHYGEWDYPGQVALKTLTDISSYTDYLDKLKSLLSMDEVEELVEEQDFQYESYSETDYLNEVFMDGEKYDSLVRLLRAKKNIILQGAPGVGKTFTAKRLAYSMMGNKDTSRVMMIQFHQSYSYEDFIMGFRPSQDGFELAYGPFYEFCKKAQDDNEREYFFIIDEINRGNFSKIFGELLMLIEKDKRGDQIRPLYSNERFSVPENVYIIGMMNTADRSLALIDYALRRRFAFFTLEPAFHSDGFQAMIAEAPHTRLQTLVDQITALNEAIRMDDSLGDGFQIGHSYLCTTDEITDEWLKSVVTFELLPLLTEYWFDEKVKAEHWKKRLCGALND